MHPKPKSIKDKSLLDSFKERYCLVTNRRGAEAHHVITRGAGGPDEEWNLMPLSRQAHAEVHQIGLNKFARKYKRVREWLLANGWQYDDYRESWIRQLELIDPLFKV